MKKIALILAVLFTCCLSLQGQENEEVMLPIRQLLLAMETSDSSLAASVFTKDAVLHTIFKDSMGHTKKSTESADRLALALGRKKDYVWSEPIWNEKIEYSGGLASVWVDYAFYLDRTLSHCGIDAFHLINTSDGWKIFHLADTRQKDGCKIPEKVKLNYK